MREGQAIVKDKSGIHVYPAARLSKAAKQFQSEIDFVNVRTGQSARGRSVLDIAELELIRGDTVLVRAEGPDQAEAVQTLTEMIEEGFS